MDDKGLSFEDHGNCVGSNFDGIGLDGLAINGDMETFTLAPQFHNARLLSRNILEMDFEFHGVRSSCSRRPCDFQREGVAEEVCAAFGELAALAVCQRAAAMTEASSVPGRGGAAGGLGWASNSSNHLV